MAKNRSPQNRSGKGKQSGVNGGRNFYLLLGGLAVAGTAALLMARDSGGDISPLEPLSVAETSAPASASAGVAIGPSDALVTIIEFADFQCPHCRNFNAVTGKAIRRDYAGPTGLIQWINYDFPLQQTSWAPALAARCGEQQGRYWQMHDLLYAMSDDWIGKSNPNKTFMELAETVGLDKDAFRACIDDRSGLQNVGAARRYGESLGVNSTPSMFINGRPIPSQRQYFTYAGLEKLIQETIAAAASTESN